MDHAGRHRAFPCAMLSKTRRQAALFMNILAQLPFYHSLHITAHFLPFTPETPTRRGLR